MGIVAILSAIVELWRFKVLLEYIRAPLLDY